MALGWRYLAVFTLGAVLAAAAQGWRYGEKIATAEATAANGHLEAQRYVQAEQDRSAAALAAADLKHTRELNDELAKNANLDDAVATGNKRLFVAAKCPAAKLPEAPATTGVGSRGSERPELDPALRPTYRALRDGLVKAKEALRLCVAGHPG